MSRGRTVKTPERVAVAMGLWREGMTQAEIGDLFGVTNAAISAWLRDPDGTQLRARKDRYAQPCVDCGVQTSGWRGRRVSPRCRSCANTIWPAERIVDKICEWQRLYGELPTARQWRVQPDAEDWPCTSVVQGRFGSWNAGIEAAGSTPRRPGERGPARIPDV